MGLHTWFFKKLEVNVSLERMKADFAELEMSISGDEHEIKRRYGVLMGSNSGNIVRYVKDKGFYKDLDSYHDDFTTRKDTDVMLFSLEETLDFIHNPENKCALEKNTFKEIKKFWSEYPDGMITFM